jgi:hypothetical protein
MGTDTKLTFAVTLPVAACAGELNVATSIPKIPTSFFMFLTAPLRTERPPPIALSDW